MPATVGQPLMLINVMSARERDRIQQLDGNTGTSAFDQLVTKLYVMTRNPNQLDIQPRDGNPDDALWIGLTTNSTGAVVLEQLGGGPKALTAGYPLSTGTPGRSNYMHFDGTNGMVQLLNPHPYPDVTNEFTIEFWARPTAGRATSIETNTGVEIGGS
ncbi:MAG: hypothetical protein WDM76_10335 [Limisphaerales bacterium]